MYLEMSLHAPPTAAVARGMALLHMSRLLTCRSTLPTPTPTPTPNPNPNSTRNPTICSLGGEAHLNFIGNEFGHLTLSLTLTLATNPTPTPTPTPTPNPNQATKSPTPTPSR